MATSDIEQLLAIAVTKRASDIHVQPKEDHGEILFRVDGYLSRWEMCSKEELISMISKTKYIADMDIGEKRFPQDGSLQMPILNQLIHMRLSTLPTVYGEKLVIRLFPQQQEHLSLPQLGFTSQQFLTLQKMVQSTHGLMLITGPTGSGKTTTLYKILEQLAENSGKNICSLEDPVEVKIPTLSQVQINPAQGFTFAKGLRSILRQDPDIIFVGEIRDEETAEIAVRASLTGHFVLSTLHTQDCVGAIVRLLEMGVTPYYLASALIGVISQRLFRLTCPYCQEGCYACFYTGYLGRKGVFEMLPILKELEEEIRLGGNERRLRHVTQSLKIASIAQQMIRHVATQLTTNKEVQSFLLMEN